MLFFGFAYLVWAMLIVFAIGAALAAFLLAYGVAWGGVGVDAILRKSSGSYRAKRISRGPLRWPKNVENAMNAAMSKGTGRLARRR